jgi:hypothetical protein
MKMGTVTLLQEGTMNDELRMTNTSTVIFIRHSSFLTQVSACPALFIGVRHSAVLRHYA